MLAGGGGAGTQRKGGHELGSPSTLYRLCDFERATLLRRGLIYNRRIIISTLQGCCQALKCLAIISKGTASQALELAPSLCRLPIVTAAGETGGLFAILDVCYSAG